VRISASEAQAFDVLADVQRPTVRLHGAKLGQSRAPIDSASFGDVVLSENEFGVDVRVNLATTLYRVEAVQGATATIVELHISPTRGDPR
jgi:hypothetical protein